MNGLIDSLRTELEHLEEEVRQDPRLMKIARIKALMELYYQTSTPKQEMSEAESSLPSLPLSEVEVQRSASPPGKTPGSKAYRVRQRVRKIIEQQGPTHRLKLLSTLTEDGLMGKERNPLGSLAAYLSEWRDEFASDGKGSFSLRVGFSNPSNENGLEEQPSSPSGASLF